MADVADEEWARSAAVRWDELRLSALEARFDALLALGRHGEAVSRAGTDGRRAPAARGVRPPADDRPLSLGSAGRRAARVTAHPDRAGRGARARSVAGARQPADRHPQPRPVARRAGRRRRRRRTRRRETPRRRRSSAPPPTTDRRPRWRCPARPCGPAGRRSSDASSSSAHCTELWSAVSGRRPPPGAADRRGRRRQVAAGRPLRRRRPRHRAASCCGAGPRRTPSCRSSRWSRRCAPRCARSRPEAGRRVAAERGILSLLLPELDHLVPGVQPERPGPERRAVPAVRDRGRAAPRRVPRAPAADRARRRAVGRRRRR